MEKYEEPTLEAIIANAVDHIVGSVETNSASDIALVAQKLDLTEEQALLAIAITNRVFGVAE